MLTSGGWIGEDGFPLQDQAGVVRYYTRHPDTDEFVFADSVEALVATGLLPVDADGIAIPPSSMTFFPALIDDHPDADFRREYKRKLASLPMFERRRRLEGNWYVSEEAGKYFNAAMFKVVDYLPSRYCRQVRSWDNAWSTSDKADWTPGVLEDGEVERRQPHPAGAGFEVVKGGDFHGRHVLELARSGSAQDAVGDTSGWFVPKQGSPGEVSPLGGDGFRGPGMRVPTSDAGEESERAVFESDGTDGIHGAGGRCAAQPVEQS